MKSKNIADWLFRVGTIFFLISLFFMYIGKNHIDTGMALMLISTVLMLPGAWFFLLIKWKKGAY